MNIGKKIKKLRRQRGVTQQQLANSIGISFQAVSKWENNIALPDITLAPVLASYFGVTMDELFENNLKEIEDDVEHIVNEAYESRESDSAKSRQILAEGLQKYPQNVIFVPIVCKKFNINRPSSYNRLNDDAQPVIEFLKHIMA